MKKVCFICPYFGRFPNYFQLYLNSCKYNPDFNWLIITDDCTRYEYPDNVKVLYWSFEKMQNFIRNKFDFPVYIGKPYKLCDFKPTYGWVFREYLSEYEYWGHCDIDCIYGDLKKFLWDKLNGNYDKVLSLGHMEIYKNEISVAKRYELFVEENYDYKKILASEFSYAFDENFKYGMNAIYGKYGFSHYIDRYDEIVADIYPYRYSFSLAKHIYSESFVNRKGFHAKWSKGKLYIVWNGEEKEAAYIHLQKRKMEAQINNLETFMILNNFFSDKEKHNQNRIEKWKYILECKMKYIKDMMPILKRKVKERIRKEKW